MSTKTAAAIGRELKVPTMAYLPISLRQAADTASAASGVSVSAILARALRAHLGDLHKAAA